MDSWEDFLVPMKLSETLLDELRMELGAAFTPDIEILLSRRVGSKKDVTQMRKTIKEKSDLISADLMDELKEALREISSDIDYVKTDLGKTVLALNRWAEPWYKQEIRSNATFEDIMIVSNAEDLFKIYVVGTLGSVQELEQLQAIIDAKSPPFEVVYNVEIRA